MPSLRITQFNAAFVEAPTEDNEELFGMDDDDRAKELAGRILQSKSDIIALNEVFPSDAKDSFIKHLRDTYPYYVREVSDGDAFEQDSGLMLFSRYPFLPLPNGKFKAPAVWATANGQDCEHVAFREFEHTWSLLGALDNQRYVDAAADKGVMVVLIETPFGPIPFGLTHLWASYAKDGMPDAVVKIHMRKRQLDLMRRVLEGTVGAELAARAIVLGDINIIGNWDADIVFPPLISSDFRQLIGETLLSMVSPPGQPTSTNNITFEEMMMVLPAGTQAMLQDPKYSGLEKVLLEFVNTGAPFVSLLQYPPNIDRDTLLASRYEWETSIKTGPLADLLEDTWVSCYANLTVGANQHADRGHTNGNERLDYVLSPRFSTSDLVRRGWTVQHLVRTFNLRNQDAGIDMDWGQTGLEDLSDHLGVSAYIAMYGDHCRPELAQQVTSLPAEFTPQIRDEGTLHWFSLPDVEGSFEIYLSDGAKALLYRCDEMSIPIQPRFQSGRGISIYKLERGSYYARIGHDQFAGNPTIRFRKLLGNTRDESILTEPCEQIAYNFPGTSAYGVNQEVWFALEFENPDNLAPQSLGMRIGVDTLHNYGLQVLDLDGNVLYAVENVPAQSKFPLPIDTNQVTRAFVKFTITDAQLPHWQQRSIEFMWTTNLVVFGGTPFEPMNLQCHEITPGGGDDEIEISISSDKKSVTNGYAKVRPFVKGSKWPITKAMLPGKSDVVVRALERIDMLLREDDTGDVFGSDPENFDLQSVEVNTVLGGNSRKRVVVKFTRDGDGVYTLTGYLARSTRLLNIPYPKLSDA